jgi:hypothetical protein
VSDSPQARLDLQGPELLECCRNRLGAESRHLRVMGTADALCGARDQAGAGAGTFASLLRWPTCRKCRSLAEAEGPHPKQAEGSR